MKTYLSLKGKATKVAQLLSRFKAYSLSWLILIALLSYGNKVMGQKTWDGGAGTQNWGDANNWNPDGVPLVGQTVTIGSGFTVVVNGEYSCVSLSLSGNAATTTVSFNPGASLSITGAITFGAPSVDNRHQYINVNDGTLTCASITMANTNNNTRTTVLNIANGSVTVNGDITTNGAVNENYVNLTGSGQLHLGGAFTGTFNISGSGSTVRWFGDNTNFRSGLSYHHLILEIPNTAGGNRVKASTAATTVAGDFSVESLHATRTLTFNPAGSNFTVMGNTYVLTRGIINDNTNAGANTFVGMVTVEATGSFTNTNNPPFIFQGGITNNGTFNKIGTGAVTFNGNQTLSGSNDIQIAGAVTISNETIVTNEGTVTLTGVLTGGNGNSEWINGSGATLSYANATQPMATGKLTATANNNTVNYNLNAAQNITNTPYFNLTTSVGGTKAALGALTVNGNLDVATGSTLSLGTVAGISTIYGDAIISGTFGAGTTAKTITIQGNLSGSGTLSITGAGLAHVLNLGGEFNSIGTFTTQAGSGSTVNYNREGDQELFVSTNYRHLTISGSGVKKLMGAITVNNNLTVTGTSTLATQQYQLTGNNTGQLLVDNGATLSIGSITNAANTPFPTNYTTATITLRTNSTVVYQSQGAQSISATPSSYGNLSVAGGNTKSLLGSIVVSNTLHLGGANLSLGAGTNNLTLSANSTVTGTYSATNMIVCAGTGNLIKQGTLPSHFVMEYPIGTGSVYSPMNITSLSATIDGTGLLNVRVLGERAPYTNVNDLDRHWITSATNLSGILANIQFTYGASDVGGGNESIFEPKFWTGTNWVDPPGASAPGSNPFTTTGASNLNGIWTEREPIVTYYSYQSGSWNTSTTWTTDPSGSLSENPGIPTSSDRVVILNGRTVTVGENTKTTFSLQINEGGVLNLGSTTGHDFGVVTGQGLIRLSTDTFPSGTYTSFTAAGGGTVEYTNSGNFSFTQYEYNNLVLSLSNAIDIATINNHFTVNGDLTISVGNLRVGNNTTSRNLTVYGSITLSNQGTVSVNNANVAHNIYLHGDLTNNGGSFKLHNLATPSYNAISTTGYANLQCVSPDRDQTITCDGAVEPYWIYVNKGSDQTYMVNVVASGDYFKIFGHTYEQANNNINITNGTLRLGENITIPQLANNFAGSQGLFYLPETGHLWIDGAVVTNTILPTYGRADGFYLYGKVTITSGSLIDNSDIGVIIRETGVIIVEGGSLSTSIIRPSVNVGVHRGTYIQRGGVVNVLRDVENARANGFNMYASLALPYPDNVFEMNGGVLNILNSTIAGNTGAEFSLHLGMSAGNIRVTGGQINITIPTNRNARIATTGQLGNVNFTSNSATYQAIISSYTSPGWPVGIPATPLLPLIAKGNLTLTNLARLSANNQNVIVAENFTINSGTTYTPGTNSTIFNGTGSQTFSNSGTITTGLRNLVLAGTTDLTLSGTASTFTVLGNLEIGSGTILRDNTKIINVAGNIVNSGTHIRPDGAAGQIVLTGGALQEISGDGNGSFNNLTIEKSGQSVTISANITVNGNLRLINSHRINLGSNQLTMGGFGRIFSSYNEDQVFTINKMIVTNGLGSDGGIKKVFGGAANILFPYGFYNTANTTYYYMPSRIVYTGSAEGTVASRPVNARQPLAQGTNNALNFYWKNSTTGFDGVANGSFTLTFDYNDYFVPVPANESSYVPGVYRYGTSWEYIDDPNQVDQTGNRITFANQNSAKGEHTAGLQAAFGGIPVLYSRTSGNWNTSATWSTTGHDGDPASVTPTASTLVIIGDGNLYNHEVTITDNARQCGGLRISSGSILDLTTTTGHNFSSIPEEVVTGAGTLRISTTTYFPRGDFGDFIGPNGGTVEYFSTSANLVLPLTSDVTGLVMNQYRNLVLRTNSGRILYLPNQNITIHEDLEVRAGSGTVGQVYFSAGANFSRIIIKGNLKVNAGILEIREGTPVKTITVYGDVNISGSATFRVRSSAANTNHILELFGNLNNEGTFNMHQTLSTVQTIFKGTTNTVISGNGATFNFYNITVDKGTNRNAVVTLQSNITTGVTNPFLILNNGTFRLNWNDADVSITDGTTNFTIPSTAALSVSAGKVRIGNGDGNANLVLGGRLEVLGGEMHIGNTAFNRNNSIEYAAAGNPEVIVEGGNLYVNGQIRRPTTVSSGSLHYKQSDGTTTIYGKARQATRGLIEINNTGSLFQQTGGTLEFDVPSAAGTTFGDLLLRPDSTNVSGGTIKVGLAASSTGHIFRMNTSTPVWNFTVGDESVPQYLRSEVLGAVIVNQMLINPGSQFRANGLDVTFQGSLVNNNISAAAGVSSGGYQPGSTTQTTIFNGSSQQISGTGTNLTNFANVRISSTGNVTLQSNSIVRVNGELNIETGTLNDGENPMYILGNVKNTGVHTSPSTVGGIFFVGSQEQIISGLDGVYGNVVIDNSSGVSLINNSTINGRLTFTTGNLYIDDYLLILGTNSSISGTPDKSKMILLNGALSDQGVKKLFPSGAYNFTIPMGVSGKYTPASYNISANSAPGTITVRPINRNHPAVADTVINELAFYWSVDSTGFGANLSVTHTYQYVPADVAPTSADDNSYVVGLYRFRDYKWAELGDAGTPGMVDEGNRSFTVSNVGYLTGDFTIGYDVNFTPPLEVYYSRNNRPDNNWDNPSNWSTVGHDDDDNLASVAPYGNPTIIANGHTMVLNTNSQYHVSVEVNGTLDCSNTVYHNLGKVFGTGIVKVTSTPDGFFVFPGGSFDEFFATLGTTVEFAGNNTAALPLKPGNIYKPFNNVVFSGTGQKNMSAENMKVLGNLTIQSGAKLSNTLHNKNLYLSGNWTNGNAAANTFIPGTGTVFIEGTTTQFMYLTTTEKFYNFAMANPQGLIVKDGAAGIEISRKLTLTSGIIFSGTNKEVTLTNTSASIALTGGGSSSYVDGPVRKRITTGQSFNFPVGKAGRLGRVTISNTSASTSPALWTAEYFNQNPHPTYPTEVANLNSPLTAVSNNEYWVVGRPNVGASANIRLRYDVNSFPAYTGSSTTRSQLRVVEFEGGGTNKWSQRGQTVSGNATTGTVSTTTPVTQNDFVFSLGAIGLTATIDNTVPIAICDNEEVATIPVSFSGTPPFVLNYRTTGTTTTNFTATTNNPTYNISLRGEDMGGYSPTPYTLSLISFTANGISGIVSPGTVEITVKLTHKPSIIGSTAVALNETRLYSTENHVGSTYAWQWVGSSGGAITPSGNQANILFNTSTGTYTLRVTETSASGCSATNEISIVVNNVPVPSINPTTANVCIGLSQTYYTNYTATNEYFWTVVGGSCVGCGTWVGDKASIDVTWTNVGDASIQVIERIKLSPGISGTATNNLYVYPMPSQRVLDGNQVCVNQQGEIVVQATELGFTYQLRRSSDDFNVGASLPGNSGNRTFLTGNLTTTTGYNVLAYNLGCQLRMPEVGDVSVTVEEPEVTLLSDDIDQIICTGSLVEFTASNTGTHPATQFHFFVNGQSKQDDVATTFATATLSNHDTIKVVGTTAKGCRDTSNIITVSVGDQIWSGAVSGNWNLPGNWACPDIPTIVKDVTVPQKATNMPIISADAAVLNLTIEPGATLTHNGGIFSIAGDIINNGTFTTSAQVTLTEGNNQAMSGSSGISMSTLAVDKNAGDVTLQTSVTISGTLTLTQGVINTTPTNILTISNGATASSGNSVSFVNGPLRKVGNSGFVFPVGGSGRWARIEISEIDGASPTSEFVATYIHSPFSNLIDMVPTLNNVSEVEYWDLSNPTGDASCNVTLFWEDVARSNINLDALADLRIAHFDGLQWLDHGNASVSAGGSSGSIKTAVKLTSFSPVTFGSEDGSNPLPVELINFKASVSDSRVMLSWSTASEHNNSHFEIERSATMEGFASIGRLNSNAPNGNSSRLLDYLYTDNNANRGQNYYRLKQVDFDGKYAYSNIVAVWLDEPGNIFDAVSVYPNPTTGKLKLNIPSTEVNLKISLYNSNGALLVEYEFDPHQPYLDLGSYQNGIFLLKIANHDEYVIHRIVKQ